MSNVRRQLRVFRILAVGYGSIVGAASAWAWYVDAKLLHNPREHLLPDMVLSLVSLPMSLSLGPLYDRWSEFFAKPFTQLAWLTLCGTVQVVILFLVSWLLGRKRER
jgi:hypothetical protein